MTIRTTTIPIDTKPKIEQPKSHKRKVTFADAHGRPLFVEKIFKELPDEPSPLRNDRVNGIAERLKLNLTHEVKSPTKTFEFSFPQPMSDYIRFKVNFFWHILDFGNL